MEFSNFFTTPLVTREPVLLLAFDRAVLRRLAATAPEHGRVRKVLLALRVATTHRGVAAKITKHLRRKCKRNLDHAEFNDDLEFGIVRRSKLFSPRSEIGRERMFELVLRRVDELNCGVDARREISFIDIVDQETRRRKDRDNAALPRRIEVTPRKLEKLIAANDHKMCGHSTPILFDMFMNRQRIGLKVGIANLVIASVVWAETLG